MITSGAAGLYSSNVQRPENSESPTTRWGYTGLFYVPELHSIKLINVEFRKERSDTGKYRI